MKKETETSGMTKFALACVILTVVIGLMPNPKKDTVKFHPAKTFETKKDPKVILFQTRHIPEAPRMAINLWKNGRVVTRLRQGEFVDGFEPKLRDSQQRVFICPHDDRKCGFVSERLIKEVK